MQLSYAVGLSNTSKDALALADEIDDGPTGFLIERALDEARASQFRPAREWGMGS
jgi:hypothetical protein